MRAAAWALLAMPPGWETVRVPETEQLRMRSCSPWAQLRADLLEGLCPAGPPRTLAFRPPFS